MTNLLEKALLTGFGILVLTIFLSMINPFIVQISEFNGTIENDIIAYENFFNEVDIAVKFIIENPDAIYLREIDYPKNLNVTFNDFYVKYDFLIENKLNYKIYEYNKPFINIFYRNLSTTTFILNVSCFQNFIAVYFN
ncbi:MAG: hypothetical protein CEE42_11360 [Promethearchaeota archaeon Loki_b31]|nr:MAG: hypothetical protein CEE42_11360 [Candidatus Lokiarchaeota archaeon Loki_b31]